MNPTPPTLLIVDDDDVDFKLLQHEFSKRKIINHIVRAKDGIDALEKIESAEIPKPFIVLLDLNMPRMGGMEFLKELRQRKEYEETVVFILSTSADVNDIKESYLHHAAGYFLKDNANESIERLVDVLGGYFQIVMLPTE